MREGLVEKVARSCRRSGVSEEVEELGLRGNGLWSRGGLLEVVGRARRCLRIVDPLSIRGLVAELARQCSWLRVDSAQLGAEGTGLSN